MTSNKSHVFLPFEEESDQNEWEPLNLTGSKENEALVSKGTAPIIESSSTSSPVTTDQKQSFSSEAQEKSRLLSSSSFSQCPPWPTAHSTRQHQQQLDRNNRDNSSSSSSSSSSGTNLQQELFLQPLQLLWMRFWVYLVATCWQQYRFPLILMAMGTVLQVFTWWHYFALSPRLYLTALLMIAGFVYLQYDPNKKALLSLDVSKYGRGLTLWWLCLPALLELRALHLLVVQLLAQHASVQTVFLTCAILTSITIYYMKYKNNNNNNDSNNPRHATYQAWFVLYTVALLVALASCLTTHSGALLAPLLTCTGILLMTQQANPDENDNNDDQWMIQQALRHGLHDVLQTVGTAVQQDELLQLAMVRWIVEYWSTNKGGDDTATASSTAAPQANPSAESRPSSYTATANPAPRPSTTTTTGATNPPCQELGWSDLFPMLTVTADQLATEVQVLQHSADQNPQRQPSENQQPQQQQHRPSPQQQQQQHTIDNDLDALASLKSMLASMNIDEDAKPSVDAYRNAVQAFPPAARTAIAVSVLRRCPATVLLLGHALLANTFWSLLATLLLLGPLVVLEYMRINVWVCACQPSYRTNDRNVYGLLQALEELDDPMLILLSDDQYDPAQPPTLLLVWQNVVDSVHALELSLTTARCVQTTAVAVDFAQNILSLAQFGWEVSQHGWGHGARVLVQEWMHLHNNDIPARTRYKDAAQNALRNGQTMNRNLRALWVENQGYQVVAPLMALVPALIGYGWIWGGADIVEVGIPTFSTESTVVIEELDEHEENLKKEEELHVKTVNASKATSYADLRVDLKSGDTSKKEAENCAEDVSKYSPDPLIPDISPVEVPAGNGMSTTCSVGRLTAISSTATNDRSDMSNSTDGFESLETLQRETHALPSSSDDTLHQEATKIQVAKSVQTSLKAESMTDDAKMNGITAKECIENDQCFEFPYAALPELQTTKDQPVEIFQEDLKGEILELMALCDENGCLDKSDKAEMLKQLSENNRTSEAWLQGTKNTLQCLLNQASMEGKCTEQGEPFDDDDDDSFEPLESGDADTTVTDLVKNSSGVVVSKTSEGMVVPKTSDFVARGDEEKEEDENLLVKVGGGLAILGAVVGGVALAAAALKKDTEHQEKESKQSQRDAS